MFYYKDHHHVDVQLSFIKHTFSIPAKHVLVVVKHKGKWLMTKHPIRGIEFPGGKVEENEGLMDAAIREVKEETGVVLKEVKWIAEYVVFDKQPFCKAVFTGKIDYVQESPILFETEGLLWLSEEQFRQERNLSFHMVDEGMSAIMKQVNAIEE